MITFDCKHVGMRVTDTERSKDFYINKLGLTLLDEKPNFFAAQVGQVRFSFFGGYKPLDLETKKHVGSTAIFSTTDIEATRDELLSKGLTLAADITNANNYLKFITLIDPDGLVVDIAQYLVPDTLEKKV